MQGKNTFFSFTFLSPKNVPFVCREGLGWRENKRVCSRTHPWGLWESPKHSGLPWVGKGWHRAPGMPADEGVCNGGLWSLAWDVARETPHWLFPWQHHSWTGMESLVVQSQEWLSSCTCAQSRPIGRREGGEILLYFSLSGYGLWGRWGLWKGLEVTYVLKEFVLP